MSQYIKVNGILRNINKEYTKVGGILRDVTQKYVKVNGVLRNLYNRDFSKNEWIVLTSNSGYIPAVGSIMTELDSWIFSRGGTVVKVTLQSTMEFLKGDTFNITLRVYTDEDSNPDAIRQGADMIVYNSNSLSNGVTISGSSPNSGEVQYTGTLTLTQNGYLKIDIELESCGDDYFSVFPIIKINDNVL